MDNKNPKSECKDGLIKDNNLQKLAEEYDFIKDLDVGTFLDIKDTTGNWCLAQVIKKVGDIIRVHYDGWSDKYDEEIKLQSLRIAPFRSHTRGYTGQKSSALRNFQFSAKYLQETIDIVEKLEKTDFTSLSPYEFTQFVRGKLFLLADSLMTIYVPRKENGSLKTDLELVLQFCQVCIKFICKWLSMFQQNLTNNSETTLTPSIHLVSQNHAVSGALPELSEMLKSFFGLNGRCESTFLRIAKELSVNATGEKPILPKINIAVFQENKGFEFIDKVIKIQTNEKSGCPIAILLDLLEPAAWALKIQKEESAKLLAKDILNAVTERIKVLGDKDIKDIQKTTIERLYNIFEYLMFHKEANINSRDSILNIILNIAIQLIKSTFIQKKLLGLSLIKDMIPKNARDRYGANDKGQINYEWRDSQSLLKCFGEVTLLDIILGENAHAEVLRKIEPVFLFLLKFDKFEAKHVELIWKCCNEKHEDIKRICFSLLGNMINNMSYPLLQELFSCIEKTATHSELSVKFLEQYTNNVITKIFYNKEVKIPVNGVISIGGNIRTKTEPIKYKLFNLDLFWMLVLDSSNVTEKIKGQAMNALIGILNKHPNLAEPFVAKALESIGKETSIARCLQMLVELDFASYYIVQDQRQHFVFDLKDTNPKYNLIQNCLKDCEAFHCKVTEEILVKKEKIKDLMNYDFGTGLTFAKQSSLYIDFLNYCNTKGKISIIKEELLKIWKIYVENRICGQHADILFSALQKETRNSYCKFSLFKDETAKVFFNEILCLTNAKLTQSGFSLFKSYMMWVNEKESMSSTQNIKVTLESFKGLSSLWNIAFKSEIQILKDQAKDCLVDIIDKHCSKPRAKKKEILEKAMEMALLQLKENPSIQEVRIALNIINAIIDRIECLKWEEITSQYSSPPLVEFEIYLDKNKPPEIIFMNEKMRFSNLKIFLSNKYKFNKNRLAVQNYSTKMEYDDKCDFPLTNFKRLTDNKFLVNVKKLDLPLIEMPRYILSNSSLFLKLQNLLNSQNEEIVKEIWNLILNLPCNEEYEARWKKLALNEKAEGNKILSEWENYLQIAGNYDSPSLAYHIYILETIFFKNNKADKVYKELFLKKGGLVFVSEVFAKKKNSFNKILNIKCLDYTLKILHAYINEETYSKVITSPESEIAFWKDISAILDWIRERYLQKQEIGQEIDQKTEKNLFVSCVNIHNSMVKANQKLFKEILKKEFLDNLKTSLLKSKNEGIQLFAETFICDYCKIPISKPEDKALQNELKSIILSLLMEPIFEEALSTKYYFELTSHLIKNVELDYNSIQIPNIIEKIKNRQIIETSSQVVDYGLSGMLEMLKLLFKKCKDIKNKLKDPLELNKELLDDLFLTDKIHPKCKSETSRNNAINLLETLLENFPETHKATFIYLCDLHMNGNWRTNKKIDWNIQGGLGSKSGKYAGLKNQGATCYFNSTLQQMYMIPSFRQKIVEVEHKNKENEENMLFQLQLTLSTLKESQRSWYNPNALIHTFKMDGKVLDVNEQKDVDEFLINFLDHLEQELKDTPQSRLVKDTFKLRLANEIICRDCPHKSETNEDAISLILSVKNKKTIYESLNAYVQSDTLEGDNAYYCERCDRKVAAFKRQNIKTLPNVLLIVLKRFEFNVETLVKVKINDYCEFPLELDMEEFTQEGQAYKDLNREIEAGRLSKEDLNEEQKKLLQVKVPKEYYSYKLKGIIIHSGHVDGGHYYSFIMDRETSGWFEYNDTLVKAFNAKDIPEEAYGGIENNSYYINGKNEQGKEKIRNAYVLIYERIVQIQGDQLEKLKQEEREIDTEEIEKRFKMLIAESEQIPKSDMKIPERIQRLINQDNKKHWHTQYMFQPHYLNFVVNVITSLKIPEDFNYAKARDCLDTSDNSDSLIEEMQFAIVCLLTTALRTEKKEITLKLLSIAKEICRKNIKMCIWLCKLFCHPDIIQEFLSECPLEHVRGWVSGLLNVVLQQLYPLEKTLLSKLISKEENFQSTKAFIKEASLQEDTPCKGNTLEIQNTKHQIPFIVLLINSFIQQIWNIKDYNAGHFYKVFCYFAKLGIEAKIYLNMYSMLGISMEVLRGKKGACSQKIESTRIFTELKETTNIGATSNEHIYESKKLQDYKRQNQHKFLYELIYLLLSDAEHQTFKIIQNPEARYRLDPDEDKCLMLFDEPAVLDECVAECEQSKVSLTYLSKILTSLAFNDEYFTEHLFTYLKHKFGNAECNKLRLYFRIAFFLISSKDKFVNKPEILLTHISELFKKNATIFRISEKYIDFMIKLARGVEFFMKTLIQDKRSEYIQMLEAMEKWLRDFPYPIFPFPGTIFKTRPILAMNPGLSEHFAQQYPPVTDSRKSAIRQMKRATKLDPEENSDDDMYTRNIQIKEKAKYDILLKDEITWVTAEAVNVTEEVTEYEYATKDEVKKKEWIEIESNRIAPPNTMVKNIRWKIAADIDSNLIIHN